MWGRAGAHSGSASVVSAFSSPLLAPGFAWRPSFRGRRCYTHLPPGGLALGVIPTGVRLFFFYFLNLGGEVGSGVFSFLSVFHAQCVNRAGVCECIVALCTYSGFNREEIFALVFFLFMLVRRSVIFSNGSSNSFAPHRNRRGPT